jgi:hypothetical protein
MPEEQRAEAIGGATAAEPRAAPAGLNQQVRSGSVDMMISHVDLGDADAGNGSPDMGYLFKDNDHRAALDGKAGTISATCWRSAPT